MFMMLRGEPHVLWRAVDERGAELDIPELANAKHVFVKAAIRADNRAENSHQLTRERKRLCEVFASRSARRLSCRASVRSASTSH